jgi:hypothetical protein
LKLLKAKKLLAVKYDPSVPDQLVPYLLASYLSYMCLKQKVTITVNGKTMELKGKGCKFSTADQIRSSATWYYVTKANRVGHWRLNANGKTQGVPTRSQEFKSVLAGIKRIKVKSGH